MLGLVQPYFKKILQRFWKIKLRYICASICFIVLLNVFGAFTHIFEVPYNDNFIYPYEGDVQPLIEALKHNQKPDVDPTNVYNYSFIHNPVDKCVDPDFRTLKFVFLVKSGVENFNRREGIRNSWGFGKRFFDVPTRLIFLLGKNTRDDELTRKIEAEAKKYKDILQADFVDAYYNNTIKTMMGFKWAVEHCTNAKFYMFVDDDVYVSVKNVLRFVRNPASYPDYLKEPSRLAARKREIKESDLRTYLSESMQDKPVDRSSVALEVQTEANSADYNSTGDNKVLVANGVTKISESSSMLPATSANETRDGEASTNETTVIGAVKRRKRQVFDLELPDDVRLYAGYVFVSSPHRHKTSKWYVSLEDYPYHLWPPYVTAGAYVLSKEALRDMYYASLYTKHFKFDDIYLAIVAKKADIEPFHCDEFHFYKKDYTKYNYKYVITSHGYDDPKELVSVWQEQKSLGNA